MKRFKNILVIPSEPLATDPGLQRAVRLADNNVARLTVMWPLEEANDGGTGLEYFPDVGPAIEDALEKAVEPAREQGLNVRTMVRIGRPFIEIIHQVQEAGHDLVDEDGARKEAAHIADFRHDRPAPASQMPLPGLDRRSATPSATRACWPRWIRTRRGSTAKR